MKSLQIIKIEEDNLKFINRINNNAKSLILISHMDLIRQPKDGNPYYYQDPVNYILEVHDYNNQDYIYTYNRNSLLNFIENINILDIASFQNILFHVLSIPHCTTIEMYYEETIISTFHNNALIQIKHIPVGVSTIARCISHELSLPYDVLIVILQKLNFKGSYHDYKEKIIIGDISITKSQMINCLYSIMKEIFPVFRTKNILIYSKYINLYEILLNLLENKSLYDLNMTINTGVKNYMEKFYKQKMQLIYLDRSFIGKFKFWLKYNIW